MAAGEHDSDRGGDSGGRLCVIATPLGNAEDLSPRARATLGAADLVLAEDTRSARRLLATIGGARPGVAVLSCFDGNEAERAADAVARVAAGQVVALVSEAGTPLVSDPGFRVVAAVATAGLRVQPIPGPSALLGALVGSGISSDRFTFLGFPPRKRGARRRLFESLRHHPYTLVLYESPMRTAETLDDLAAVLGGPRPACVARELTKTHEEFVRGTLQALAARYRDGRPLGEITLVVSGAPSAEAEAAETWTDEVLAEEAAGLLGAGRSARDAADELAARSRRPRRQIYAIVTRVAASTAPR